jgi:hypothetical protein
MLTFLAIDIDIQIEGHKCLTVQALILVPVKHAFLLENLWLNAGFTYTRAKIPEQCLESAGQVGRLVAKKSIQLAVLTVGLPTPRSP